MAAVINWSPSNPKASLIQPTKIPVSSLSTVDKSTRTRRRLSARAPPGPTPSTPPTPDMNARNLVSKPLTASRTPRPLAITLVPIIGILTSTLLYFSPMAAVRVAVRDDAVGDLNPLPLAMMAASSLSWLVYGLSVRDPYVTLSNVPGSIASLWYVAVVLPLLQGAQLQTTQHLLVALAAIAITLWTYLSLSRRPLDKVQSSLGLFASALFVLLSGSPLSTIMTVLAARDSVSILTPLTIAQVINTSLWSAYGLAIGDTFVYGPNLTGLGFGLVQLVLKLAFPSK